MPEELLESGIEMLLESDKEAIDNSAVFLGKYILIVAGMGYTMIRREVKDHSAVFDMNLSVATVCDEYLGEMFACHH